MNRNTTLKKPRLLLLALLAAVFVAGLGLCTVSSFAAGENYNLTVQYTTNADYNQGVPAGASIDLTLYRVGDCAQDPENGKWDEITMAEGLGNITLTKAEIQQLNRGTEAERIQAWLNKADTIDQMIAGNEGLQTALEKDKKTLIGNGSVTFTGLDQGLYLIHSSTYEGTDGSYWKARPMLVQVVAASNTANLKPVSQKPVDEITIIKVWAGDEEVQKYDAAAGTEGDAATEDSDAADGSNAEGNIVTAAEAAAQAAAKSESEGEATEEPASVETVTLVKPASISIILSYDGEQYGDPITLNEENNWTVTIKTPDGKKNPLLWSIAEQDVLSGYTPEYTVQEDPANKRLILKATNNTTDIKSRKLKLVKKVPTFVDNGGVTTTGFTFRITGYQGSNEAYHNTATVVFKGPGEEATIIEDIPLGLSKVVVEELPTANYEPADGKYEKEATLNGDVYEVEFTNNWNGKTLLVGDVINHYKQTKGKYVFDFREGIVWKK